MKITLICSECGHEALSTSDKQMINKIIMWNHVKKSHPRTAERVMRLYKVVPNHLYGIAA